VRHSKLWLCEEQYTTPRLTSELDCVLFFTVTLPSRHPGYLPYTRQNQKEERKTELYVNSNWTKLYGNVYIAEALAWSVNGNHATVYATGTTADEANAKLASALRELRLVPDAFSAKDELNKVQLEEDRDDSSKAS
jgi:hypothetical protein